MVHYGIAKSGGEEERNGDIVRKIGNSGTGRIDHI